jgi:hypothetical protein
MKPNYLRLDRHSQVTDYLKRAEEFLRERHEDMNSWKWFIFAIHGALYDLAVSACSGTNSKTVLTKRGRLIAFHTAFDRCKSSEHAKTVMAASNLKLTEKESWALNFLKKELRNPLEHFAVGGWSIEISGMPAVAGLCLDICDKLLDKVVPPYKFTLEESREIRNAIQCCRNAI